MTRSDRLTPLFEQELMWTYKRKHSRDDQVAVSILALVVHLDFSKISLRSSKVKISHLIFKKFKDFLEKCSVLKNPYNLSRES